MSDLQGKGQARRVNAAEFVTRLFILTLVALLLVAVGYIVEIRVTQTHNTKKTDKTVQTLAVVKSLSKQINSCVTPGMPCYQQGQQRTAGVLSDVSRIVILSAACSIAVSQTESLDQRISDITSCVTKRLGQPEQP